MIFIKKEKTKKIILIILLIVIAMIIFAGGVRYILLDEGIWKDNERGKPSAYTDNTKLSGEEGIVIDKDKIINEILSNLQYSDEEISNMDEEEIITLLDMENKLGKTVSSLSECTNAEILWCASDEYKKHLTSPEDLERLLNAELITQYPKIEGLSEDKLNGIVEFERHETDPDTGNESITILKYIGREDFTEKINNYSNNGNRDVLNYFTLDDDGNIVIATWSREEGAYYSNNTNLQSTRKKIREGMDEAKIQNEIDSRYNVTANAEGSITANYTKYTIHEQTINYKMLIQQYTLPFEYLWSLLVMGRSDEFVLELTELIYDSEIKIGILDNINKSVVTNIERYTEDFKERYEKWEKKEGERQYKIVEERPRHNNIAEDKIEGDGKPIDEKWSNGEWKEETYEYEHKNVITTYQDITQIQVIHAKTWIVDVDVPIENTENNNTFEPESTTIDDNGWINESEQNTYRDERQDLATTDSFTGEVIEGETYYVYVNERNYKYKRTLYHTTETETNTTIRQYQLSPANIKEKVDIDPNTENNFVKCLRANHNAFIYLTDITGINWLTNILEADQDTYKLVDLTKFLINKAKHPDDTSLFFDFGIFTPKDFNSINSGGYDTLRRYIRFFEHSTPPPTNADGTKYIIENDGAGNLAVGYGIDIFNGGYANLFIQAGYPTTLGGEVDIEFVDALEENAIKKKLEAVRALTSGLNLKEYQIHALVCRAYNTAGEDARGAITVKRGYPAMDFIDSYKKYWKDEDDQFEEKNNNADFNHNLYKQYLSTPITSNGQVMPGLITRRKSEWRLFQTGYYDTLDEWYVEGGTIIQCAQLIHEYMEKNHYTYCVYWSNSYEECDKFGKAHGLSTTFEKSKSNKNTCCATYVSWVLQEAGYMQESEHTNGATALRNVLLNKGWQKVSISDLEPGDVLYYTGRHVEIYAGNGTVYNAGSGGAIRGASPEKSGGISSAACGLRPPQ